MSKTDPDSMEEFGAVLLESALAKDLTLTDEQINPDVAEFLQRYDYLAVFWRVPAAPTGIDGLQLGGGRADGYLQANSFFVESEAAAHKLRDMYNAARARRAPCSPSVQ